MHPSPEKKQIKLDFSEKAYMLKASKQASKQASKPRGAPEIP